MQLTLLFSKHLQTLQCGDCTLGAVDVSRVALLLNSAMMLRNKLIYVVIECRPLAVVVDQRLEAVEYFAVHYL